MIKIINLLLTIVFISTQSGLFAQTNNNSIIKQTVTENKSNLSYPIPGSHLLREKEQIIYQNILDMGDKYKTPLQRPTDWGFTVGSTQEWWADELTDDGEQYQVPSTCRAVGTNCYIFVEDAIWDKRVDQSAVDEIATEFDNNIYPTDTATFGDPPNVDGDERIIILILDIQDGWSGSGGYVAGYFYSANEYPDGDSYLGGIRSNFAEIFYMDCDPADLSSSSGRLDVLGTTAHEFQHMIHFAYGNDMTFIDEGLSMIAEYVCYNNLRSNGLYAQNTNVNLLSWELTGEVLDDYSRAALWTLYLYEQFPNSTLIKDIVIDDVATWADLDQILRNIDANRDFFTVYKEWLIANYVNGYSNDSRYQYQYSPITQSMPVKTYLGNPNGQEDREVEALGAEYIKFEGGTDLTINFTGDATIRVYALKLGSLEIEEVTKGSNYSPTNYGDYSEVTFLVLNKTIGTPANYSYTATGGAVAQTIEFVYEDGIPEGYLKWETGDSCAVWFDAVTDGELDSVKIAFRRNGRVMVDISKLGTGSSFRGENLYGPTLLTVQDSTSSSDPYPNPYDNWYTIDLSQRARPISTTDPFVVSSAVGSNPAEPGIMISSESDDGIRNSRTYIKADNQWYYITDGGTDGNIFKYLIRAYVRIGGATVAIDQNGIVSIPDEFSLGENYPNPFNPTTTFNFATPKDGLVNFTVHDLLGREIYSEHRNLLAGNYAFTWNGQNNLDQQVVSGVYFLKMEADGFAQTRKMLMMK